VKANEPLNQTKTQLEE
jgi:hypothetical protein